MRAGDNAPHVFEFLQSSADEMGKRTYIFCIIINRFGGYGPSLMPYKFKVSTFMQLLTLYAGDRVVDIDMKRRKCEALRRDAGAQGNV